MLPKTRMLFLQLFLSYCLVVSSLAIEVENYHDILQPPPTFNHENLPAWIDHLQQQFSIHDVSQELQTEVGISFLNLEEDSGSELQAVMDDRRKYYLKFSGEKWWDWEGFVMDLQNITVLANSQANPIDQKISDIVQAEKTFEVTTLQPLFKEISKGVDDTTHSIEDFWIHDITPALEGAAKSVAGFLNNIFDKPPANDEEFSESRSWSWIDDFLARASDVSKIIVNSLSTILLKDILPFLKDIQKLGTQMKDNLDVFRAKHPYIAASIGATLAVAGASIILPAVGAAFLNAVGFGAMGPIAGSIAAWIQATIYGAWTTGVFSALQAFAMTYISPTIFAMILAGTASGAGIYLFSSLWYNPPDPTSSTGSESDWDDLIPILQSWNPPLTFTGNNPDQDVLVWFGDIERACTERGIPKERFRDVAMYFFQVDMVEIV